MLALDALFRLDDGTCMNVLIAGLLKSFCAKYEYETTPEHQAFELLSVHSLYTPDLPDSFSLDETMAGDETVGYDSLAIFANGDLVTDAEEAQAIVDQGKAIDVSFFFLQAKTSPKFEREQILGFGQAVRNFFGDASHASESPFVAERRHAKDVLYAASALFRNRLPILRLYYVTTGTLAGDVNITGAAKSEQQALLQTDLFEDVQIRLVGASELHKAYVAASNRVEATLNFQRRVGLPKIGGVDQAFIGVLPVTEFMKLISTEDGESRKSVFYDNVRDFQQWNAVNNDIYTTLTTSEAELFPVLNNGVTLVAQKVRAVGDDVTIEDFQIVNGCQTSHVIHAAQATGEIVSTVLVPLRLIVTEDELVASKITKATNNQTAIEEADLVALTEFQKELEAHYRGYGDKQRLYYERRSRQYADAAVEQTRVVPPLVQIRAFAAMFLEEPHAASRYYRGLYDRVPSDIFNSQHRPEPYYTSAFAWYRLDVAFRLRKLDAVLKPARYLILAAFRELALPRRRMPPLNSQSMVKYCSDLNGVLTQEGAAVEHFRRAGELILKASEGALTRDRVKRERLTRDVLGLAAAAGRAAP